MLNTMLNTMLNAMLNTMLNTRHRTLAPYHRPMGSRPWTTYSRTHREPGRFAWRMMQGRVFQRRS